MESADQTPPNGKTDCHCHKPTFLRLGVDGKFPFDISIFVDINSDNNTLEMALEYSNCCDAFFLKRREACLSNAWIRMNFIWVLKEEIPRRCGFAQGKIGEDVALTRARLKI